MRSQLGEMEYCRLGTAEALRYVKIPLCAYRRNTFGSPAIRTNNGSCLDYCAHS